MNVLLLNAGSSSLKCSLTQRATGHVVAQALADWAGETTHYEFHRTGGPSLREEVPWRGQTQAVRRVLHDLQHVEPVAIAAESDLEAVGHRVVHGGPFTASVRVTPEVQARINQTVELAPLHNPSALEALAAAQAELPHLPHIAVFDTAFHATLAEEAYTYPLPYAWRQEWGVRRYGFHGLSHAYCAQRAAEMLAERAPPTSRPATSKSAMWPRLVICHLGHGCSAAAVAGGKSVDTTMGFTPLEGLMMATRSGSVDPGILLHLQQRHGITADQLYKTLNRESGLLAISGVSADMREILAAADAGNARAALALAMYTRRIRQTIGALAVTMGGIDALVLTAGVGEHASAIRATVCQGLACLGLELDDEANRKSHPDADIAAANSPGRILIIATREDVTMLREVQRVLAAQAIGD